MTALMFTSFFGHLEATKLLIENKAEVNFKKIMMEIQP